MRNAFWCALVLGCGLVSAAEPEKPELPTSGECVRVSYGELSVMAGGATHSVRLIGVKTIYSLPRDPMVRGTVARGEDSLGTLRLRLAERFLAFTVQGKRVELEDDPVRAKAAPRFGPSGLPAYVWLRMGNERTLLNEHVIRQGFALADPEGEYREGMRERLAAAENDAREHKRGLWADKLPVVPLPPGWAVGSGDAKIYHRGGCRFLPVLRYKTYFCTPEAARAAGYRGCRGCGTPKQKGAAERHIDRLFEQLWGDDKYARGRAWKTLVGIGAPVVDDLVPMLTIEDVKVRRTAVGMLNGIGREAKAAAPALIKALSDKDAQVRGDAAEALGKIGRDAKAAVPGLIRILADKRPAYESARGDAAEALGNIGPDAAQAVPALLRVLDEESDQPADRQGWLLNSSLLCQVIEALGKIGPPARAAIPRLVRLLDSSDFMVRGDAIMALGHIGQDAVEAVPDIVRSLAQGKSTPKPLVEQAIIGVGSFGTPGLRALVEVYAGAKSRAERAVAAFLFVQVGSGAHAELVRLLADERTEVRLLAASVIRNWSEDNQLPPEVIPALEKALKDPSPRVREAAKSALELGR
jgi:HEAT repeat protein/endonuclease YncB( thermonuclease family)